MSGQAGVRRRRSGGGRICLACGNIVSHHRVGGDVGCSAAGFPANAGVIRTGVGSWNELSRPAGLACGRTGRGPTPNCLTALRSD
ncbi:hypothetical protein BLA24_11145 [Streptomyces cinnamoneus]|uniref:Uncharacterized protein n=1 Tax=Streptomyces cinnamoneus TaxID=53446 RepID=A0A2G1XKX4_STRCJ|nr:hypothetical protein BLA24_11145 [Streptomyces cinnamoneus]PPT14314.1 hypothetical protein CYQ11_16860 [Streptomyces cinnamoneus]